MSGTSTELQQIENGNAPRNELSSSSFWGSSSWFQDAAPCVQPVPVSMEAPRTPGPSDLTAAGPSGPTPNIGGAGGCQSRFTGVSARPIATVTPMSTSLADEASNPAPVPPPAPVPKRPMMPLSALASAPAYAPISGRTCAELPTNPDRRWKFDLEAWEWVSEEGAAGRGPTDRHVLAARRWGDGRDGLASTSIAQVTNGDALSDRTPAAAAATPANASRSAQNQPRGFSSLGGLRAQKRELKDVVTPVLLRPDLIRVLGLQPTVGLLLHGPPGTGKTSLALALAAEMGPKVHAEVLIGPEVASSSGGSSLLRAAFRACARAGPSVLVIDEIDALCPSRDGTGSARAAAGGSAAAEAIAAELLTLLDAARRGGGRLGKGEATGNGDANGGHQAPPLVVVCTTSRRGSVDSRLVRPGRIDREVSFSLPSQEERAEVLEGMLEAARRAGAVADDVDVSHIAEKSRGFVPSDLLSLYTHAALRAIRQSGITADDDLYMTETEAEPTNDPASSPMDVDGRDESSPTGHPKAPPHKRPRSTAAAAEPSLAVLDRAAPAVGSFYVTDPVSAPVARAPASLCLDAACFDAALAAVRPAGIRSHGFYVEVPQTSFDDVAGLAEVKRELQEALVLPLTRPDLLRRFGARPPRGMLLYGPPGNGKTMLARAVASSCGANFLPVQGPQLLDMWLGESERAVRELFATARRSRPCVIFFDEIDAVAARRGPGSDAAIGRVLNQLLTEMDGLSSQNRIGGDSPFQDDDSPLDVFVLAATNRPEAVDPALLRPGRLDTVAYVPLPDSAARRGILERALGREGRAAPGVDLGDLSGEATEGMSGADVYGVAQSAVRACIREAVGEEARAGLRGDPRDLRVQVRHIDEALATARRSVTAAEVKRFESMKTALQKGALEDSGAAEQRMKTLVSALAAQLNVAREGLEERDARIRELEAMVAAKGGVAE